MAKKRIYELINKVVLTVTDLFMVDKNGDTNATYVTGQQLVDLVDANISRVESVSGASVDNSDPLNPIVNVTDTNFATDDLTFTANRTHDLDGYDLTFGVANFGGTVKTISPGATSGDTAFSVRNNTDTSDMFKVLGDAEIGVSRYVKYITSPGSFIDFGYNGGVALIDDDIATMRSPTIEISTTGVDHFIKLDSTGRKINTRGDLFDFFQSANGVGVVFSIGIQASTDKTLVKVKDLPTYADNTAALAGTGMGVGFLYIRTGHGLDVTV